MVWTAPLTAVTGNVFTAAQFNQHVRDNLNTTAPAVATGKANLIVTLGANIVGERSPGIGVVGTSQTTTTTTFTDLGTVGPSVTVTSGTKALVTVGAAMSNGTAGLGARTSAAVSGSTTTAASDGQSFYMESPIAGDTFKGTWTSLLTLTAGSNTFTQKYRAVGGGTATIAERILWVLPF